MPTNHNFPVKKYSDLDFGLVDYDWAIVLDWIGLIGGSVGVGRRARMMQKPFFRNFGRFGHEVYSSRNLRRGEFLFVIVTLTRLTRGGGGGWG